MCMCLYICVCVFVCAWYELTPHPVLSETQHRKVLALVQQWVVTA